MSNKFVEFPKIKQLSDAVHNAKKLGYEKLQYTGRPKAHGTHGAIVKTEKGIHFQSRKRVLSLEADNAGFMNHFAGYAPIFDKVMDVGDAYFGEWMGPGVQKGVALNQLSCRFFMIFAWSEKGGEITPNIEPYRHIFRTPGIVHTDHYAKIPFEMDLYKVDVESLENITARFEALCPIALKYGIAGVGEGLVWTCDDYPDDHSLWFKTKGEEHTKSIKTIKLKKDFAQYEEVEAMAKAFLTEGRCLQAWSEVNGGSMAQTGDFIKWLVNDVKEECHHEIVNSNFDFKIIAKVLGTMAAQWYKRKVKEVN